MNKKQKLPTHFHFHFCFILFRFRSFRWILKTLNYLHFTRNLRYKKTTYSIMWTKRTNQQNRPKRRVKKQNRTEHSTHSIYWDRSVRFQFYVTVCLHSTLDTCCVPTIFSRVVRVCRKCFFFLLSSLYFDELETLKNFNFNWNFCRKKLDKKNIEMKSEKCGDGWLSHFI